MEDKKLLGNDQPEQEAPQTEAERSLALKVQRLFRESWDSKQQLNLPQLWRKFDDYKHNRQNPKQSEDHPGSTTNVIHRVIESQISDLLDKPYGSVAKGTEPGDDMFSEQAQHMVDFVLDKGDFKEKINLSEHDRLELGDTIIKVWTDKKALSGKGLPVYEIVSPANFFSDPKITAAHRLQESEFVIHATPRALSWYRRQWPKLGKYVQRQVQIPYDPNATFTDDGADEVHVETSMKALLLECYLRDEEGEVYCLHVANDILLEDSRKNQGKLQRRNLFPFVQINCYPRRGTSWGMGDVEYLIPTQDLINELDDQIRINARLMGNPQIVVGQGAGKGFDFRKWTSKPALRIPMRDVNAFRVVPGVPISPDVPVRRDKAFQEADIISGVNDVSRGEKPGQVTAAAAIYALQQAGQKGVIHKNEMLKNGWSKVLGLLFDEIMDNWDEEMWIRIDGEKPDFKFVNPADFKSIPILVPNAMHGEVEGEEPIKQLTDESGKVMTREAEYDFQLSLGNGLPYDKAFVFQTLLDMTKVSFPDGPAVTRTELRKFLRDQVGLDLEDQPEGTQPPEQPPMQPGMPPVGLPQGMPGPMPPQAPPPGMGQPPAQQIPPEILAMIGGVPQ
ncbi:portal protein [Cohnella nanjingensis]|uniref:Portal protein n=1 Tax=Cohnella nanjingensis TaxID=1387779 RepID=A0A7X0RV18_9BACL|nr:hypothetical protein [Cohnella nanjingensis]MBB6672619.1 hypothetical protein [Cohnella nanjingensis]